MNKICTICGKPVEKGQPCIKVKRGKIHVHTECYENEQRELKAEREGNG